MPVIYFLIMVIALPLNFLTPGLAAAEISEPVISLTPDRLELLLKPGETVRPIIAVTNRTPEALQFTISIEDFGPAEEISSVIRLYGLETGPYSLKDYIGIAPEYEKFVLSPGESLTIPFTVSIPAEVALGGLYGAVMVGAKKSEDNQAQAKVITRLGSLIFVRLAGSVSEAGELKEFGLDGRAEGQLRFQLLFENRGDVHLNPYGFIVIYDWFGKEVSWQEIEPWFVLPRSFRRQEVLMPDELPAGYYRAVVILNRGYADQVDKQSLGFWSWPAASWLGLGLIGGSLALGRWWLGRYSV